MQVCVSIVICNFLQFGSLERWNHLASESWFGQIRTDKLCLSHLCCFLIMWLWWATQTPYKVWQAQISPFEPFFTVQLLDIDYIHNVVKLSQFMLRMFSSSYTGIVRLHLSYPQTLILFNIFHVSMNLSYNI